MKKKVIIVVVILLILIGTVCTLLFLKKDKKEEPLTSKDTYVKSFITYLEINPSIEFKCSQTCQKDESGKETCADPIVDSYTLVNEDANEIYDDVDLLAGGKKLIDVINLAYETAMENNIDGEKITLTSDWKDLQAYIDEKTTTVTYTVVVNIKEKDDIIEQIKEDKVIAVEKKEDNKEEKKEETPKTETPKPVESPKEEPVQSNPDVIMLSDNVTYSHTMRTYECVGCFSDTLINTLRTAKGHYLIEGFSDIVFIKVITGLSGKYNSETYYGHSYLDQVEAAGGEEVGGGGGNGEPLTMEICNQYHLKCE